MKITAIETVRIEERANLIWILVHTDEGITGLGETFYGAKTVEAHIHEYIAPRVIGRNPLQIDFLAQDLVGYLGFRSSGAEVRGNSAFDIALWDIFGKVTNQPIASCSAVSAVRKSGPTTPVPAPSISRRTQARPRQITA